MGTGWKTAGQRPRTGWVWKCAAITPAGANGITGVVDGAETEAQGSMKLTKVEIENYRGIKELSLPLDPKLTVLHGGNGCGKTSILTAIALALGGDESWSEFNRVELDRPVGYFVDPVVRLHCSPSSARSVPAEPFRITLSAPSVPIPGQPPWHRETMPPYGRPIFRFYNIDREIVSSLAGREMGSRPNYDQLFEWFYAKENEEQRRRPTAPGPEMF